jgi:hypothetical protein
MILVLGSLLFFVLLPLRIESDDPVSRKERWVIAALLVCVPAAVITAGKEGAVVNSLLPAFLAISAFCAMEFPLLLDMARDSERTVITRVLAAVLFPVLLFLYAFPLPPAEQLNSAGAVPISEEEYVETQQLILDLPGIVICPEDPTLTYFSRAELGRSFILEYDAALWPRKMPDYLLTYLKDADYVVDRGPWPWGLDLLTSDHLTELGFEKVNAGESEDDLYSIWVKRSTG